MTKEEGVDISHWQGTITAETISMFHERNVKFCYAKASQGLSTKDKQFENSAKLLQDGGILVGAYHFMTNENALAQANWFIDCIGDVKLDLPPAMDCEYTSGLGYPQASVIDSMGMQLTSWMQSQSQLSKFPYPVIYTNPSNGNTIFTPSFASMKRYLLWIAHWGVSAPTMPRIWSGENYFVWQDGKKSGSLYGVDSSEIDHNVWGTYMPFPGSEPQPNEIEATLKFADGKVFTGKLQEVV